MPHHPRERALLASLPAKVRAPLAQALARTATPEDETTRKLVERALLAAGVEHGPGCDRPDAFTPTQRTVAELLAYCNVRFVCHGLPETAEARRRALGIDPPGTLERIVDARLPDEPPRVPLWYALFQLRDEPQKLQELVKGLKLPILARLEMFTEIERNAYGFTYEIGNAFPWGTKKELETPKVARWAARTADAIVRARSKPRDERDWWYGRGITKGYLALLFHALVHGKVKLKSAWDELLPVYFGMAEARPIIKAIPPERRGAACVKMLDWHMPSGRIGGALAMLAEFPSKELVDLVLAHAGEVDHVPKRETMKQLDALARKSPVVRAALGPLAGKKPALNLTVTRAIKPHRLEDLTPLQREQLVIAGTWYDTKRWSAAVRLGLEIPKGRRPETFEGSFAGWLEVRELVDERGRPAYTAFLYLVDYGTVFEAGTTKVVASIGQSTIELTQPDPPGELREALQVVVQSKLPKKRATKKRATKTTKMAKAKQ